MKESPDPPGLGRLGMIWVVGLVLYSAARALAARELLAGYGILPWLFFCLDAGSAVPMAIGQVRIVQGLRGKNPAIVQKWSILTGLAFFTPYAYLLFGGNRPLPTAAYVVIGVFMAASVASTIWKIRAEKRLISEGHLDAAGKVEVEEERR
jgi:hypothetical protein